MEYGFTATESIPLLMLVVFVFLIVVVILKRNPETLVRRALSWISVFGLFGIGDGSICSPETFGRVVGLINGMDWSRLLLCTLLLLFFALYGIFTILQGEGENAADTAPTGDSGAADDAKT